MISAPSQQCGFIPSFPWFGCLNLIDFMTPRLDLINFMIPVSTSAAQHPDDILPVPVIILEQICYKYTVWHCARVVRIIDNHFISYLNPSTDRVVKLHHTYITALSNCKRKSSQLLLTLRETMLVA